MKNILRRLRGALGNALIWGGVWSGATFTVWAGSMILYNVPLSLGVLTGAIAFSAFQGAIGFVTGGAFSAYVAGTFRERRIEDLSPGRFALGGALVAIPFALLLQIWTSSVLGFEWIFMSQLITPALSSAALGGLTGYGTAKLAQRELGPGARADELESRSDSLLSQP